MESSNCHYLINYLSSIISAFLHYYYYFFSHFVLHCVLISHLECETVSGLNHDRPKIKSLGVAQQCVEKESNVCQQIYGLNI